MFHFYRHAPRGTKSQSPSPSFSYTLSQCHTFNDLVPSVMEMFYTLGPHLHTDPILLCKLVRIGKAYFKEIFSFNGGDSGLKVVTPEQLDNVSAV